MNRKDGEYISNDWVLPCIAGNFLMVAMSDGAWLILIAGWAIIKLIDSQKQKG